jgi:signal transduction histidine kinase
MAASGGVNLVDKVPPGLCLHVDRKRLKQITANLLSNAVKYNRQGGSVVVAVDGPPLAGFLQFSVTDTGLGMDAEQLARIFQPFDRLGAQRGTVAGTGLGLAISKQLAEAMGGGIRVSSEPGRGTAFFVNLPVCAEPAEPSAARPTQPPPTQARN